MFWAAASLCLCSAATGITPLASAYVRECASRSVHWKAYCYAKRKGKTPTLRLPFPRRFRLPGVAYPSVLQCNAYGCINPVFSVPFCRLAHCYAKLARRLDMWHAAQDVEGGGAGVGGECGGGVCGGRVRVGRGSGEGDED